MFFYFLYLVPQSLAIKLTLLYSAANMPPKRGRGRGRRGRGGGEEEEVNCQLGKHRLMTIMMWEGGTLRETPHQSSMR